MRPLKQNPCVCYEGKNAFCTLHERLRGRLTRTRQDLGNGHQNRIAMTQQRLIGWQILFNDNAYIITIVRCTLCKTMYDGLQRLYFSARLCFMYSFVLLFFFNAKRVYIWIMFYHTAVTLVRDFSGSGRVPTTSSHAVQCV